jgi:hypothetical protein
MSAHPLEVRMAHLEGAYEQVSERLTSIDTRLMGFEQRVEQRFGLLDERLEQRFSQIDRRFEALSEKLDQRSLWLMGLVLISILLPIATRLWH